MAKRTYKRFKAVQASPKHTREVRRAGKKKGRVASLMRRKAAYTGTGGYTRSMARRVEGGTTRRGKRSR